MTTHALPPEDTRVITRIGLSVAGIAAFALLLIVVSLTIG